MYGTGNITKDLYAYEEINTVYEEAGYVVHKLWPRFGTIKTSHYYNFSGSTKVGCIAYCYCMYVFLYVLCHFSPPCLLFLSIVLFFVVILLIYHYSCMYLPLLSFQLQRDTMYNLSAPKLPKWRPF